MQSEELESDMARRKQCLLFADQSSFKGWYLEPSLVNSIALRLW